MYPDHVKDSMAIKNTSIKCILLLNVSIIEINMEFKPLLWHRRC